MLTWPAHNFIEKIKKNGFSEEIEKLVERQHISMCYLSYHPRVLNEEECQTTKMFYGQFVNTSDIKQYEVFELKLVAAFKEIFRQTDESYLFREDELILIQNESTLSHQIQKSLRKEERMILFSPEKQTIVSSGYDLTWQIFSWVPLEENLIIKTLKNHKVNIW